MLSHVHEEIARRPYFHPAISAKFCDKPLESNLQQQKVLVFSFYLKQLLSVT